MRNIPENNLAYPILIKLKSGHLGSGFQFLYKNEVFLITAKHVLLDEKNNLLSEACELICQTNDIDDETETIMTVDFKELLISNKILFHPTMDVAGFKLADSKDNKDGDGRINTSVNGVSLTKIGKSGTVIVNGEAILQMKDVLISNDIFVYGYPSSLGLRKSPQFDYSKPLLRKGIIASVNKSKGTIILDCPVYYGNSGGPVIQVTKKGSKNLHNVIGVVSQFIPYAENWINQSNKIVHTEISNSGYSVAVAMDSVLKILKK